MCHQNKQFAGNILQVLHGLTTTVGYFAAYFRDCWITKWMAVPIQALPALLVSTANTSTKRFSKTAVVRHTTPGRFKIVGVWATIYIIGSKEVPSATGFQMKVSFCWNRDYHFFTETQWSKWWFGPRARLWITQLFMADARSFHIFAQLILMIPKLIRRYS